MLGQTWARSGRLLVSLSLAAGLASFAAFGSAYADSDNISQTLVVPVAPNTANYCAGASSYFDSSSFHPSTFSFDISWVDPYARVYLLAERLHGDPAIRGGNTGDIMVIDANDPSSGPTYLRPPANDPMGGAACDNNAAFGGLGTRSELDGPNGVFTVNHVEAWAGDAPTRFQPTQDPAGQGTAADYANDPCDSSVRVFNLATGKQTDHINVGGCFRTDEGAFDPVDQVALFANPSEQQVGAGVGNPLNRSPFVTLISTEPVAPGDHHKIIKQINFDGTHGTILANGGIEQAVYSRDTGLFYIAVPANSTSGGNGFVVVVDPRSHGEGHGHGNGPHVVANWQLTSCSPNGASLGPDNELFLGCDSEEQVIDIRNGHLVSHVAGSTGGCDEVSFNSGDDHFVGACGPAGVFGIEQVDADPVKLDQHLMGAVGAHSIAADGVTNAVYLPAGPTQHRGPTTLTSVCESSASPLACVAIFTSSGGDDKSLAQLEGHDDHQGHDHH